MSVDKFGRQSSSQSSAMAPGASVRYVNNNFIRRDGSNDIEGELSMNNHKLVNLFEPTEQSDGKTGDNEAKSWDLRQHIKFLCALCILNELRHFFLKLQ